MENEYYTISEKDLFDILTESGISIDKVSHITAAVVKLKSAESKEERFNKDFEKAFLH